MKAKKILVLSMMLAMTAMLALSGGALADTTLVVSPANLQGWQLQPGTTGQTVTFEQGPDTPPLGTGSVEFNVGPNGVGAAQVRQPSYQGTKLSDLTALSYSTYVDQDGSGGQAPYIILQVDLDGDLTTTTDRTLLFFEPVYQTATFFPSNPQQSLALDTWQTWDALNGGWWSTTGVAGASPGTGVKPLSDIIALHPNATIHNSSTGLGGVRLVAGFGAGAWDNFIGNADAFKIGVSGNTTTYDFEADRDGDGVNDVDELCPNDPNKTAPGVCGCGTPDTDSDGDGTPDCVDSCPNDPNKTVPGVCGCGVPDTDTDGDGVLNCIDNCPTTPNPTQTDVDGDGKGDVCDAPANKDACKNDGWKTVFRANGTGFKNQGDCIQYVNTLK